MSFLLDTNVVSEGSEHEVAYHGYRLREDDRDMRETVLKEWQRRCRWISRST